MPSPRSGVVSSFTIVKGALIEETYAAFQRWDPSRSWGENLRRVREENTIGAPTRQWALWVTRVLHRRFDPSGRDRLLAELAQANCPLEVWRPLLLWHMTRDEFLLKDFLIHWLFPRSKSGGRRVRTEEVVPYVRRVAKSWSESTIDRVASALLRIAADFGRLAGGQKKEFSSFHLPEESFLYLLQAMAADEPNARRLIESEDWQMFLLEAADVEREILRLHQFRKLRYDVAGSLAQLDLPCGTGAP